MLLLASAVASSQTIELSVVQRGSLLHALLSFRWAHADEFIDSLRSGLESRITFTTRLYEKRKAVFSFTGDRLIAQRTVSRSAFWDFLDQIFVVEDGSRRQKIYARPDELVRGFFALEEVFATETAHPEGRRLYVSARAQFEPVSLVPPLTLIGLAGAGVDVSTPWVRKEVP
jgi:hypothetical protein